jgi:hypothetical protein
MEAIVAMVQGNDLAVDGEFHPVSRRAIAHVRQKSPIVVHFQVFEGE